MKITKATTLTELAAIVSETLERAGVIATLSGGAAVSIYSDNKYQSEDLDFVTAALVGEIAEALEPLGFEHAGRPRLSVFEHPKSKWYIEFPPAPLSFGGTYIDHSQCRLLKTTLGNLRIITPTQSVMDRLVAAAAWDEPQSLEQAILVAQHQNNELDWAELDAWVVKERITGKKEVVTFYDEMQRDKPITQTKA